MQICMKFYFLWEFFLFASISCSDLCRFVPSRAVCIQTPKTTRTRTKSNEHMFMNLSFLNKRSKLNVKKCFFIAKQFKTDEMTAREKYEKNSLPTAKPTKWIRWSMCFDKVPVDRSKILINYCARDTVQLWERADTTRKEDEAEGSK